VKQWFREYKNALKMLEVEEVFDLIIYRPLAFLLVKIVYPTNITPNQLTLIAVFFGLVGGICYTMGTPEYFFAGGVLYILYDVFDCSDGQLARIKKNGTKTGRIIDGVADYIATIAAYIGIGIGFAGNTAEPGYFWMLTVLAGASSAVLSILLDYYRNRFLDIVLERESVLETELREFTEEYDRIKTMKRKYFDKILLKIYLKYSKFQVKMAKGKESSKKLDVDSKLFYSKNKTLIHLWSYVGPTTQLTFMIFCSLINRMDIYLYGMITLFPVYALIIFLKQNRVDKELKIKGSK